MKRLLALALLAMTTSCVSDYDRIADCKKKYPNAIVTPSTELLSRQGYHITVEDTITKQIYAVRYFPFSATNISDVRNIR